MDKFKLEKKAYPELVRLSMDELEKLLVNDSYESGVDMDYIQAILEVIEQREAEDPAYKPFDVEAGYKSFMANYAGKKSEYLSCIPLDDSTEASFNTSKKHRLRIRKPQLLTAVASIVIVLGGMLTAEAVGFRVFQTIAQWTEDVFFFRSVPPEKAHEHTVTTEYPANGDYASIQEALDNIGITQPIAPKWHPGGFVQTDVGYVLLTDMARIDAFFVNENQSFSITIKAYNTLTDDHFTFYEKDDNPILEYESGGITHYLMANNSRNAAAWMNGYVEVLIQGDVSIIDLQRMIDSIYGGY